MKRWHPLGVGAAGDGPWCQWAFCRGSSISWHHFSVNSQIRGTSVRWYNDHLCQELECLHESDIVETSFRNLLLLWLSNGSCNLFKYENYSNKIMNNIWIPGFQIIAFFRHRQKLPARIFLFSFCFWLLSFILSSSADENENKVFAQTFKQSKLRSWQRPSKLN